MRNIGVNSMSPTTISVHPFYTRWTNCSLQLASLGVNPSKVKQGMKTWSSGGKPVGGIVLFSFCIFWVPFLRLFSLDETMKCNDVHNWIEEMMADSQPQVQSFAEFEAIGRTQRLGQCNDWIGDLEGSAGNVKLRTKKNKSIKVSNYSHRIS